MSFIEITSLVLVALTISALVDAFKRSAKHKKTKDAKNYLQIKIALCTLLLVTPSFIYSMCISKDEIFQNALLFSLTCNAIIMMKLVPIVLKEEMKKLP